MGGYSGAPISETSKRVVSASSSEGLERKARFMRGARPSCMNKLHLSLSNNKTAAG